MSELEENDDAWDHSNDEIVEFPETKRLRYSEQEDCTIKEHLSQNSFSSLGSSLKELIHQKVWGLVKPI